jgi:hypothetical protein
VELAARAGKSVQMDPITGLINTHT